LKAILQINNIEVFIGRGLPMVCQEAKKLGKQSGLLMKVKSLR